MAHNFTIGQVVCTCHYATVLMRIVQVVSGCLDSPCSAIVQQRFFEVQ